MNSFVEYQFQASDLDIADTWLLYVTLSNRPFDPEVVQMLDALH